MEEEVMQCGEENNVAEQQATRALLRKRFLETLLAMNNQKITFSMHDRINVTATFEVADIDILHFQVSNLETPIGVQPHALLRCSDVIACCFKTQTART
ncbi:gem-associated protein 7-like [Saccoglossus kowalevskii]